MKNANQNHDARSSLGIAIVTSTFLPAVNGIVTLLTHSMAPLRKLGHKVLAPCMSSGQLHGFEDDPLLDFRNDTTLSLVREQSLNLITEHKNRFYTASAALPTRGVDHILLGSDLEVVEADVVKEASSISDHLPVIARIRVATGQPQRAEQPAWRAAALGYE